MFKNQKHILILPVILTGILMGMYTGWLRIGWNFPTVTGTGDHGALMAGGFLGSLICLERTFNYPNKFALLVPAVNALSIIWILTGYSAIAYYFLLAGSLGLVFIYFRLYVKFQKFFLLVLMAGAMCYAIGNLVLIKTFFYPSAVMWWIAFLFFTIGGERLEFSQFLGVTGLKRNAFLVLMALSVVGILVPFHLSGGYIVAVSFIGSALWLIKYDMAKHSLKRPGLSYFSGIVLLTGYLWLAITGLFMAYGSYSGLLYDAVLHSFFLGFVFSMIIAHAPVILGGVLGLKSQPFNRSLYVWFILLQATLLLRISGVFTGTAPYKMLAGLLNGLVIIGFFVNMALLVRQMKKKETAEVKLDALRAN